MTEKDTAPIESEDLVTVNEYSPMKSVRLSTDLFNVSKTLSRISKSHTIRLLFALAQSVQDQTANGCAPRYRIDFSLSAVFDYLGIRNSGMRYEYLREALKEIQDNSLQIAERTSRGGIVYKGISWISGYEFSTEGDRLVIILGSLVTPYLLQLSQYASIRPIDYSALSTAYQLWFYPFLKDKQKMGAFRVSIEYLKLLLGASEKATYSNSMSGTNKFLSKVLGITISQKAKEEAKLARKERRLPKFVAWDYTRANGKPVGTLYNININTDLCVMARGIKRGRAYTEVEFKFVAKGDLPSEIYIPEILSIPEQLPQDQQQGKVGWGWVVLTDTEVKQLLSEYGGMSINRLVELCPNSLQLKDGVVSRFQEIPFRSK